MTQEFIDPRHQQHFTPPAETDELSQTQYVSKLRLK